VELKAETTVQRHSEAETGADLFIRALVDEGVEMIFGYPGGAVLPIYDAIYKASINHVLTRHEQGAVHAAEGYARVSGKPGVVLATSGPGATNLVTGIADAMMDSIPLVVFTGQVATHVIGTDAFQETDVMGITTPITKYNYQVRRVEELPRVVKEAFYIARTGRPGPVVIDIPKDISSVSAVVKEKREMILPGYTPVAAPNVLYLQKLTEEIRNSKKPVILVGAGVIHAGASQALLSFVEKRNIPVVSTLLGLGAFPGAHPLFFGMAGMHGTYAANMALYDCDLLINIGARFDDRLTGNLSYFAKKAVIAHIDIDPAEIGKNVPTHIPIVADAREALEKLNEMDPPIQQAETWLKQLEGYRNEFPLWYRSGKNALAPERVVELVYEQTRGEAVVTTDVGQHQMWAAQYFTFNQPRRWVTSGGLGTMGYGLPAAIGAQLAAPDETVIAIIGDGGFQMTLQELSVLQELRLPVKIIIINNQALGMVRQWQEAFYGSRYAHSLIPVQPDFVKLAESYDIQAFRVENEAELRHVLKTTLPNKEPVLIDCRVDGRENVYPMVAPGKGLHEMTGVKP